jgi:hypothetical protein
MNIEQFILNYQWIINNVRGQLKIPRIKNNNIPGAVGYSKSSCKREVYGY